MPNKNCIYFDCHENNKKPLEDHSFCYCPIFPCKIKETGGKWIDKFPDFVSNTEHKKKVWDCSDCLIVHNKEFAKIIKNFMRFEVLKKVGKK